MCVKDVVAELKAYVIYHNYQNPYTKEPRFNKPLFNENLL